MYENQSLIFVNLDKSRKCLNLLKFVENKP